MGNVHMEASQINYRGGETKMSVEEALKNTSGEAAAIAALQTDVGNLQSGKANLSVIAPAFSAETAYAVGDIVTYEGATYRCTTAHEGAWDAQDFAAVTIANELSSLESGLTNVSSKVPVKGFFGVACAAGLNTFNRNTMTLTSGSLPTSTFRNCIMGIIDHATARNSPNYVETDSNDVILINSVSEQTLTVRWLDLSNIPDGNN